MNDLQTTPEPRMTTLVTGIVSDVQELVKQQLALFRAEVTSDFRKTKEAAIPIIIGLVIALIGVSLLAGMLVFLLDWLTVIPLWGCYALVGGGLAILGAIMILAGKKKFDSFNPLPDVTAHALKENVQCLMNPK